MSVEESNVFITYDSQGNEIVKAKKGWNRNQTTSPLSLKCKDIVERLKKARDNKDYTQQDLANRLSINRTTIAQWENGLSWPSLVKIEEIAHVLGVKPEWIAFGIGNHNIDDPEKKVIDLREVTLTITEENIKLTTLNVWSVPEKVIKPYGDSTNIVLYRIENDGLKPFKKGGFIYMDSSVDDIDGSGYYVILFHGDPTIAHIKLGFESVQVTIKNEETMSAPLDKIDVIAKVVGHNGGILT